MNHGPGIFLTSPTCEHRDGINSFSPRAQPRFKSWGSESGEARIEGELIKPEKERGRGLGSQGRGSSKFENPTNFLGRGSPSPSPVTKLFMNVANNSYWNIILWQWVIRERSMALLRNFICYKISFFFLYYYRYLDLQSIRLTATNSRIFIFSLITHVPY